MKSSLADSISYPCPFCYTSSFTHNLLPWNPEITKNKTQTPRNLESHNLLPWNLEITKNKTQTTKIERNISERWQQWRSQWRLNPSSKGSRQGRQGLLMISLWIFGWVSWFLFLILSGSLGKRFLMFVGFVKGTRFLLLDVSLLMLPTDVREWETEWVRDKESMAEKLSL